MWSRFVFSHSSYDTWSSSDQVVYLQMNDRSSPVRKGVISFVVFRRVVGAQWWKNLSPTNEAQVRFSGPVYMEKSCPGQEGHPPSRVNFRERLYEKNVDPLPESRAGFPMTTELAHALIVLSWSSWPGWVGQSVYMEKSWPGSEGDPIHRKRVTRLGGSPFWTSQLFVSHVNSLSSFVRKYRKSWLAQGSSGRRVTLLPGTTFLPVRGASDSASHVGRVCWFSTLLWEVFPLVLRFCRILKKTRHLSWLDLS